MDLLAKRYLIISHISHFFNMQIQDYRQKKEFDVPGTVFHLKRAPLSAISGDDQGEIGKQDSGPCSHSGDSCKDKVFGINSNEFQATERKV
jgi:hypothetical protein